VPLGTKVVVLGDGFRGPGGVPIVDYLFPGTPAPATGGKTEAASGSPTPPKPVGQI
jgi:hypothetical protein